MKISKLAILTVLLMAVPLSWSVAQGEAKYTMPSKEIIKRIMEDPTKIGEIIKGASESDVSSIMVSAIAMMESIDMPAPAISAKLNQMLTTVSDVRGAAFGAAVSAKGKYGAAPEREAASGYTMPSQEEIKGIVEDPTTIGEILEGASEADVASILISAIAVMETMSMQEDLIAAKLNLMLNTVSDVRGEAFSAAVMARIRKKVNPRLLPVIPPGSAPSPSLRYGRQSKAERDARR